MSFESYRMKERLGFFRTCFKVISVNKMYAFFMTAALVLQTSFSSAGNVKHSASLNHSEHRDCTTGLQRADLPLFQFVLDIGEFEKDPVRIGRSSETGSSEHGFWSPVPLQEFDCKPLPSEKFTGLEYGTGLISIVNAPHRICEPGFAMIKTATGYECRPAFRNIFITYEQNMLYSPQEQSTKLINDNNYHNEPWYADQLNGYECKKQVELEQNIQPGETEQTLLNLITVSQRGCDQGYRKVQTASGRECRPVFTGRSIR